MFRREKSHSAKLAGVAGFEPTYGGIKTRCLTTWRHPKPETDLVRARGAHRARIAAAVLRAGRAIYAGALAPRASCSCTGERFNARATKLVQRAGTCPATC